MTSTWTDSTDWGWTDTVYKPAAYVPRTTEVGGDIAPVRNEALHRCIRDAYDEVIKNNIYAESPIMEALKKKAGKTMSSAVDKIREEREEVRARAVFDFLDAHWGEPEPGETKSWSITFDSTPDKWYHYAAVLGDNGHWHITHDRDSYSTEGLKARIVELALSGETYFEGDLVA